MERLVSSNSNNAEPTISDYESGSYINSTAAVYEAAGGKRPLKFGARPRRRYDPNNASHYRDPKTVPTPRHLQGDTPAEIFLHQASYLTGELRSAYQKVARTLTVRVLQDKRRFVSSINSLHEYLTELKGTRPELLRVRKLVEDLAQLVIRRQKELTSKPDYIQIRMSMAISDVLDYVPGVKHALNVLQTSGAHSSNYSHMETLAQGSGTGVHVQRQKQPYLNQPRNNWHAVPQISKPTNGQPGTKVIFSAGIPRGLETVVAGYAPLLGIM